jgi:hypothetical protein
VPDLKTRPATKEKGPRQLLGEALERSLFRFCLIEAQQDRPAEAGVVVPVEMRETEHLP